MIVIDYTVAKIKPVLYFDTYTQDCTPEQVMQLNKSHINDSNQCYPDYIVMKPCTTETLPNVNNGYIYREYCYNGNTYGPLRSVDGKIINRNLYTCCYLGTQV